LCSIGKLVETRKNPFQPQTEHTIAAFAITPVEDYNQITWFLARVMQMQVRKKRRSRAYQQSPSFERG